VRQADTETEGQINREIEGQGTRESEKLRYRGMAS
jgi:hypothetical protein